MIAQDLYIMYIYNNFKMFPLRKVWKLPFKLQIPTEQSV